MVSTLAARLPPPLCQVKASAECEVVGGMFAVRKGQRVRSCVPCAGTLFPAPRHGDSDGDLGDGHPTTNAGKHEAPEVPDVQSDRLEEALTRVNALEARALASRKLHEGVVQGLTLELAAAKAKIAELEALVRSIDTKSDSIAVLTERVVIADQLVELYDKAIYNEGNARKDADALLDAYERRAKSVFALPT